MSLSISGLVRVAPGRFELQARAAAGARESGASGTIAAGEEKEIVVDLTPADSKPGVVGPTPPDVPRIATDAATGATTDAATASATDTRPRFSEAADRFSAAASSTGSSRWTPLRYGAVAAGVAGVAGVAAMAVLAVRARSMWNDAQADDDSKLASRAATQANLATGAGVLGVAAIAAGTVLWFVGAPRDRESKAVTAVVDRTQVGVAVTGRF